MITCGVVKSAESVWLYCLVRRVGVSVAISYWLWLWWCWGTVCCSIFKSDTRKRLRERHRETEAEMGSPRTDICTIDASIWRMDFCGEILMSIFIVYVYKIQITHTQHSSTHLHKHTFGFTKIN